MSDDELVENEYTSMINMSLELMMDCSETWNIVEKEDRTKNLWAKWTKPKSGIIGAIMSDRHSP